MDDPNREAWNEYRSRYSSRAAWDAKAARRLAEEAVPSARVPRQTYLHHLITVIVFTFAVFMVTAKLVWAVL